MPDYGYGALALGSGAGDGLATLLKQRLMERAQQLAELTQQQTAAHNAEQLKQQAEATAEARKFREDQFKYTRQQDIEAGNRQAVQDVRLQHGQDITNANAVIPTLTAGQDITNTAAPGLFKAAGMGHLVQPWLENAPSLDAGPMTQKFVGMPVKPIAPSSPPLGRFVTRPGAGGRPENAWIPSTEASPVYERPAASPYDRPMQFTPDTPIPLGTKEWKIADDLAFGRVTLPAFRSLYAYSRDPRIRQSVYAEASRHNPEFNMAAFEMGRSFATNQGTQRQLAAISNVIDGVPDLLKISKQASRTGITLLNRVVIPAGIAFGGKRYSNLHTAAVAFADELSGALGFGTNTDMTREMGFDMTNPNLPPENFASAIEDVVIPFVNRKRATMLGQMGIYGEKGMSPAADEAARQGQKTIRTASGGGAPAPKVIKYDLNGNVIR
jgi:hypothetical protein